MQNNFEHLVKHVLSISCLVFLSGCTTTANFSSPTKSPSEIKIDHDRCSDRARSRSCYDTTPSTDTKCTTDKYGVQNCRSVHNPSKRECNTNFNKEAYFSCMSELGYEKYDPKECGVTKNCVSNLRLQ